MNRRHEALLDAESIVQNLCNRRKAVGGAGSIRQNDVLAADLVVVYAIDDRQVGTIGRSRNEDALCAALKVSGSLLLGGEDARALQHDINAKIAPGKVGRIALSKRLEGVRSHTDRIALDHNCAWETTVNAIVAQKMGIGLDRTQVVDGDDFNILATRFKDGADYVASNAAKSVDGYFNGHELPPASFNTAFF